MAVVRRIGLVDADVVAYAASSATENAWDFEGTGEATVIADFEAAKEAALFSLNELTKYLDLDEVIIALSDIGNTPRNFRKELDPTYKAMRVDIRRPENLIPMKKWLAANYRSYWKPGLEGDDVLGILATHPTLITGDKIMVSVDKDLRQIPGKLYVPNGRKKLKVTQLEGDRWFMTQTLTGDATDGYKGCPRVGPESPFVARVNQAESLKDMWDIVVEAYRRAHGTKTTVKRKVVVTPNESDVPVQHAIGQARLARILRWPEWDTKAQAPILWEPPVN